MILDLSSASAVIGAATESAFAEVLGHWEVAVKPIAIVVGSSPDQARQIQRVQRSAAPTQGRCFASLASAQQWLAAGLRPSVA